MRKNWTNYQKEIADRDYYYARSCIRQTFFPASERCFIEIMNRMGAAVVDDPRQSCCSGIGYHCDIVPMETLMTIVARQFSLMNDAGCRNFVCSCVTSFGLYNEVLETWNEYPLVEQLTRENLYKATGRTFTKPECLVHASDLVYHYREQIASQAKVRLVDHLSGRALRGVEHIGCHYAKIFPQTSLGGAEFPYVLAGMIESWGGEVVDYPERRHCCGFGFRNYLIKANRGYSIANAKRKFESMAPYKPDFIVANCPGCTMFLDRWQYAINQLEGCWYGDGCGIPVLTYEELAGLVLGYSPWDLGLQMHQISVEPLLDKLGIEYDHNQRFVSLESQSRPISLCRRQSI